MTRLRASSSRGSRRQLLLSESAESVLIEAASSAYPNETGGILLGLRSQDDPWVTTVVELPSQQNGPAEYVIPAGATRTVVDALRVQDARLGYIGDWHAHTLDVGPSSVDRATMRRSLGTNDVMLVARRLDGGGYRLQAISTQGSREVDLAVIRTGDPEGP